MVKLWGEKLAHLPVVDDVRVLLVLGAVLVLHHISAGTEEDAVRCDRDRAAVLHAPEFDGAQAIVGHEAQRTAAATLERAERIQADILVDAQVVVVLDGADQARVQHAGVTPCGEELLERRRFAALDDPMDRRPAWVLLRLNEAYRNEWNWSETFSKVPLKSVLFNEVDSLESSINKGGKSAKNSQQNEICRSESTFGDDPLTACIFHGFGLLLRGSGLADPDIDG